MDCGGSRPSPTARGIRKFEEASDPHSGESFSYEITSSQISQHNKQLPSLRLYPSAMIESGVCLTLPS